MGHINPPWNRHARQTCCAKAMQFVGLQSHRMGIWLNWAQHMSSAQVCFHKHDRPRPTSPGKESLHLSNEVSTVSTAITTFKVTRPDSRKCCAYIVNYITEAVTWNENQEDCKSVWHYMLQWPVYKVSDDKTSSDLNMLNCYWKLQDMLSFKHNPWTVSTHEGWAHISHLSSTDD